MSLRTATPPLAALISSILVMLTASALVGCGPDPEPTEPRPEDELLDRAIVALWGKRDPAEISGLRTRSLLVERHRDFAATFELETTIGPDGQYRESRRWRDFGLTETFTTTSELGWYLVDGSLVETLGPDEGPGGDQRWLFEISKLAVLRDGKRFDLEHGGALELEDGREIERLRVRDRDRRGLTLALDIDSEDWLVRRVILENSSSDQTFTLLLGDYRKVDGIWFAHDIVSRRNDEPFAQQAISEIELNPTIAAELFVAPAEERKLELQTKPSIGGWLAWQKGTTANSPKLEDLKSWLQKVELEIVGPLVVIRDRDEDDEERVRVGVLVSAPGEEQLAAIPEDGDFGLEELRTGSGPSVTVAGKDELEEARRLLAENFGETPAPLVIEIYFARDGRIRQLQAPEQP